MQIKDAIKLAIESKGKTYTALVNKGDIKQVSRHKWHLTQNGYAISRINGKRMRMHHYILGKSPVGKEVDHINGNRLDNRRRNLRFVSSSVNGHNTKAIGVRKHGHLWEANICVNYKKHFKSFKTLREAKQWRQQMKESYLSSLEK